VPNVNVFTAFIFITEAIRLFKLYNCYYVNDDKSLALVARKVAFERNRLHWKPWIASELWNPPPSPPAKCK